MFAGCLALASINMAENPAQHASSVRERWPQLQEWTRRRFGKRADVEGVLFLIGLQELGRGAAPDLDKARKEQILLEGTFCAFETLGYYERTGIEDNGHWIWEQRKSMPADLTKAEEEVMLRQAALAYFDLNHRCWIDEF